MAKRNPEMGSQEEQEEINKTLAEGMVPPEGRKEIEVDRKIDREKNIIKNKLKENTGLGVEFLGNDSLRELMREEYKCVYQNEEAIKEVKNKIREQERKIAHLEDIIVEYKAGGGVFEDELKKRHAKKNTK